MAQPAQTQEEDIYTLHVPCHFHVRKKDCELVDLLELLRVKRDLKTFNSLHPSRFLNI